MSAEIRLVINLATTDETAGDQFAAKWQARLAEVQSEPGCQQYELFRSTSHPENFAVLESWVDRRAFDAHWALEQQRPRVGVSHLGAPESRRHGRNGTEIYWEQQNWGWNATNGLWKRR